MVKRIFPEMDDRPDKGMFMAVILYGFMAFILLPVVLVLLGADMWNDRSATVWLEVVYHLLNAALAAAMFKSYLGDSFFNVQLFTKRFLKTVAIATLIMLSLALELQLGLGVPVLNAYPINELPIAMVSGLAVREQPIVGTLCYTLAAPFGVACLFYATGFAPFCCKKPWLGYLIIPFVVAIPIALDVNWRGGAEWAIPTYLLQLPIHLVACWSYQKADTIWAPITCLTIFNLATSILCLLPV